MSLTYCRANIDTLQAPIDLLQFLMTSIPKFATVSEVWQMHLFVREPVADGDWKHVPCHQPRADKRRNYPQQMRIPERDTRRQDLPCGVKAATYLQPRYDVPESFA